MMRTNRKLLTVLSALLCAALLLGLAACSGKPADDGVTAAPQSDAAPADQKVTIGILQYAQHPSLDNCRKGFLQGLADAGLVEGTDFEILYENAGADDALNRQIANNFASKDVDMMCAIATPSATACYAAAEEKNIPVIFTAITDPEAAGLTDGNVTGTSDKLPVDAQLELIRALQPEAKTIGIIYTLSEPNSVSAIEEYKEKAGDYDFEIVAKGVSSSDEIALAADAMVSEKVDCLSNLTDNNVVNVLSSILEKTDAAGIPVYGSEVEQVKNGCVAAAGIDYVELGKTTGEMAAKLLRGEATCASLPYESVRDFSTYVNGKALEAMEIELPEAIAEKAVEVNE